MANLTIFNRKGERVGEYAIDPTEIAPRISKQLLHDAVVMYQANQRLGTHRTKSRSEVAGTTKKMYRQKGTGNARAGSKRSGVRKGGGHIFAIRPRDYSYRLPRKALQVATRMAIATKIADEQIVVIDDLAFASPKTKDMALILGALGLDGLSTHIATETLDQNVVKSARNIEGVTISPVGELNALCVLKSKRLLVTKSALDAIKRKAAEAKKKPEAE